MAVIRLQSNHYDERGKSHIPLHAIISGCLAAPQKDKTASLYTTRATCLQGTSHFWFTDKGIFFPVKKKVHALLI